MAELNVRPFLVAVHELRRIEALLDAMGETPSLIEELDRVAILGHLTTMIDAIQAIGLGPAYQLAARLQNLLSQASQPVPLECARTITGGIERRFANYLRYCGIGPP